MTPPGGGHAKSVDVNQAEIVAALRACGYRVLTMHAVGGGFPDLIVAKAGNVWLLEVKAATGRLTPAQERFIETWSGPSVHVVRSIAEALEAVGVEP